MNYYGPECKKQRKHLPNRLEKQTEMNTIEFYQPPFQITLENKPKLWHYYKAYKDSVSLTADNYSNRQITNYLWFTSVFSYN